MKRSLAIALVLVLPSLAHPAPAGDPWIGISLESGGFGGARIREVIEGSPGQRAGLAVGDEVLTLNDHKTDGPRALIDEVRRSGVGRRVALRVVDGKGHTRTVALQLEARPDMETLQRVQLLGRRAPDFEPLVQAGSKTGRLSELRGHVVLIDFFATWCGPCVATMPHVEELHERLGARGLKVIGVSTEAPPIVAAAAQRFRLKYTLASDESEGVSGSYHVFALPTMVVIDRQGVVREVSVADVDAVDSAIAAALKAP
jgi:peroxiredoxin